MSLQSNQDSVYINQAKNFAIVDIETTGTHASAHTITEIAILLHNGREVIDSFQSLVNPESYISPYVSRLTGITNEMLAEAPRFHEIAKKVWMLTEGAVFVAHSVNFDYSFIREEYKSLGADFRRSKLCTVRLSRNIFPGHTSYSLGNICAALGIPVKDRHRAMGDATATVKLFEYCLQNDKYDYIPKSLKKNSREALLPPNLPASTFNKLPEKTGVYYFHDNKGKIIYVGKAINIKKRILSHFSGTSASKLSFLSAIADITFTVCGTELIALLLESSEIKRLYPIYNQAQKSDRNNYILTHYLDQKGIRHLIFARNSKRLEPLMHFRSFDAAREFLHQLIEMHELCPKCCGIQTGAGSCFDFRMEKCRGICAGKEDVDEYNKRVDRAIEHVSGKLDTKIIIDEGRDFSEKSVVLVEQGVYKGFGYFSGDINIDSAEKAMEIIQPFKHNPDVQRILNRFIEV